MYIRTTQLVNIVYIIRSLFSNEIVGNPLRKIELFLFHAPKQHFMKKLKIPLTSVVDIPGLYYEINMLILY